MLVIAQPWRTYSNPQSNNIDKNIFIFFVLYLSTCIFAFWEADTYHSWEGFIIAGHYENYQILSYENIYNWLAKISGNNYFVWRTYIWLPACLFLFFTAKKLDLMHNKNMLVVMILFGSMLSFTRGMLGHTMLLLSIVLWIDRNNKLGIRIIGLIFFCLSYYLHKSMYVNIIFALLAFYPFKKKGFVLSLIAFPFLTIVATMIINGITSNTLTLSLGDGTGGVGDRTIFYAASEKAHANVFGYIYIIISYLPEYLTLFYLVNRILYKEYFNGIKQERVFIYLFRLTYISIYIASLFAFVETSSFIYSRFKYMGYFPMLFVLAKIWNLEPRSNFWIKGIILLQMLSLLYKWSYGIYKWAGI